MDPCIEAVGLTKRYAPLPWSRGRLALRGVDLVVHAGTITVLLGPNGAGKTTLMRILTGAIRPTTGTVRFVGQPGPPALGYLPEVVRLPRWVRARSYVRAIAAAAGVSRGDADAWVERVKLGDRATDWMGRFSKGMRQRVGLAIAFLPAASFVLCDEPASGLDPAGRIWLRELLRSERDAGRGLLVSTHDLDAAVDVADRILILRDGRIVDDLSLDGCEDAKAMVEAAYLATAEGRT